MKSLSELASGQEAYIIEQRRWFHQHAELSWQEYETTAHIAEELKAMGIEPRFFPDGRTGVWAEIKGSAGDAGEEQGPAECGFGAKRPVILLRADIDALPVLEATGASYKSIHEGVMHACGHDCHAAMLLGAAKILVSLRTELTGTVRLLFQGAEETAIGAKYYVDQGILDGVSAVYGCHVNIDYPAGMIKLHEGACMPSCDEFTIRVKGVSTHGALPHQGKDAIVAAANVIMNLQTLVSRINDPLNALVVTIGRIEGGRQYNIVSNEAVMRGTVRTFSRSMRSRMDELMRGIIEPAAAALGCTAELDYEWKTGAVINGDPALNAIVRETAVEVYGEDKLSREAFGTFSDDFAFFSEKVPGFYAMIGVRNESLDCIYPHHHEKFNVDESALKNGAVMFVGVALTNK